MASNRLFGFLALVGFAAPITLTGQSTKLVATGASLSIPAGPEYSRVPVWGGEALVIAKGPTAAELRSFQAYDKSGVRVFDAAFSVPDVAHYSVSDFARGADGTLAICGMSDVSYSHGRGGPFIAWISRDGVTQKVSWTTIYTPSFITIAQDGTFWTVGPEVHPNEATNGGADKKLSAFRHWDRDGRNMFSISRQSDLPTPIVASQAVGHLAAAKDRVGWFYHAEDRTGTYIEQYPNGTFAVFRIPEILYVQSKISIQGLAITDSGEVFVSVKDEGVEKGVSVFALNRSNAEWVSLALPPELTGEFAHLYGASGADLVFHLPGDPASTVRFYRPAQ